MFKIHPEVPDSMSNEAKTFILSCFEADPDKRTTAATLLQESFLKTSSRKKTKSPAVTDDSAAPAIPERSTSAEGIVEFRDRSPSLQALRPQEENVFLSPSSSEVMLRSTHLRTPEKLANVDLNLSSSSHEESGCLFLLKKDSERRATLHKVLTEELPSIASAIHDVQDQSPLSLEHISQLVSCLKSYIRSPNRKQLIQGLLQLQLHLQADQLSLYHLQAPLFTFQDTVKQALRKLQIKPHWVFALDNLMGQAVQAAFTVLLTELKVKPWLSCKEGCGPPIKEEEALLVQEQLHSLKSCSSTVKNSSETPSSGIGTSSNSSWLDSQHPLKSRGSLLAQLGYLQAETQRLQWELMKKERECQRLLQETLQSVEQDAWGLRNAKPIGTSNSRLPHLWKREEEPVDPLLTEWLEQHGVDKDTIAT
ncbi:UNVERIFIED_CONTAM: hypothetical protein K2H54_052450, partial [Gekko kuhli]